MNPKSNYRVEEAAELCRCSPEIIMQAIKSGELPASPMGVSSYQISFSALQKYYQAMHGEDLFPRVNSGSHAKAVSDFFDVVSDMGGEEEGLDQFNDGFFHSGSR